MDNKKDFDELPLWLKQLWETSPIIAIARQAEKYYIESEKQISELNTKLKEAEEKLTHYEKWDKVIKKINEDQKELPAEFNDIVNAYFWELI